MQRAPCMAEILGSLRPGALGIEPERQAWPSGWSGSGCWNTERLSASLRAFASSVEAADALQGTEIMIERPVLLHQDDDVVDIGQLSACAKRGGLGRNDRSERGQRGRGRGALQETTPRDVDHWILALKITNEIYPGGIILLCLLPNIDVISKYRYNILSAMKAQSDSSSAIMRVCGFNRLALLDIISPASLSHRHEQCHDAGSRPHAIWIMSALDTVVVPIHRAGWPFIAIFAIVALLLASFAPPLGWVGFVATAWCVYFFRDPPRMVPQRAGQVISPADGRVSMIVQAPPPLELDMGTDPLLRISIFLNIFDVHVNRIPIDGVIAKAAYHPGRFLNAALDKASEGNERMAVRLRQGGWGARSPFVQIAGLVARRIVSGDLVEGQTVRAGERYGLIRFGSRVDVYLPADPKPLVVGRADGRSGARRSSPISRAPSRRGSVREFDEDLGLDEDVGSTAAPERASAKDLEAPGVSRSSACCPMR